MHRVAGEDRDAFNDTRYPLPRGPNVQSSEAGVSEARHSMVRVGSLHIRVKMW